MEEENRNQEVETESHGHDDTQQYCLFPVLPLIRRSCKAGRSGDVLVDAVGTIMLHFNHQLQLLLLLNELVPCLVPITAIRFSFWIGERDES